MDENSVNKSDVGANVVAKKANDKWQILTIVLAVLLVVAVVVGTWGFLAKKDELAKSKDDLKSTQDQLREAQGKLATTGSNPLVGDPTAERLLAAIGKSGGYAGDQIMVTDISPVHNSSVAPWQTVTANIEPNTTGPSTGGSMGYWYREGKNGEWIFAFGTQNILSCSWFELSTTNLIRAFSDTKCVSDNAKDMTVEDTTVGKYYDYML